MNATILIMPHIGDYMADTGFSRPAPSLNGKRSGAGFFFQTIWQLPASHRDMDLDLLAPLLAIRAAKTCVTAIRKIRQPSKRYGYLAFLSIPCLSECIRTRNRIPEQASRYLDMGFTRNIDGVFPPASPGDFLVGDRRGRFLADYSREPLVSYID